MHEQEVPRTRYYLKACGYTPTSSNNKMAPEKLRKHEQVIVQSGQLGADVSIYARAHALCVVEPATDRTYHTRWVRQWQEKLKRPWKAQQ